MGYRRNRLEMFMAVLYSVSSQCGTGRMYAAKPTRITRYSNLAWDDAVLFLDFLLERNLVKKEGCTGDKRSHDIYMMADTGKKLLNAYGVFKESKDSNLEHETRDAYNEMCRLASVDDLIKSIEEKLRQRQSS